jgi:methylmalonyl-CoA mutase N-terminal domain/subunit
VHRRAQVERLRAHRAGRAPEVLPRHTQRLVEAAQGDTNVVGCIYDAVREGVTVGEVCGALSQVFGAYHEPVFL